MEKVTVIEVGCLLINDVLEPFFCMVRTPQSFSSALIS